MTSAVALHVFSDLSVPRNATSPGHATGRPKTAAHTHAQPACQCLSAGQWLLHSGSGREAP